MAFFLFLLLSIIYASSFTLGQENHFINPPDESSQAFNPSTYPVYAVGDILDLSWSTTADVVDLIINQNNSPLTRIDRTPNSDSLTKSSYSWKVTTDGSDGGSKFDLTFSNVFNFLLFQVNSTTPLAFSSFFNISNATVDQNGKIISTSASLSTTRLPSSSFSSATLLPSSSFSSATQLPSSPSTISSSPTSTSASPSSESAHTGLGTTTNIGLGIGMGLVGIASISGFVMWYLFLRQKKNRQQNLAPQYNNAQDEGKDAHEKWWPPSELHVSARRNTHPTELPI